MVYDITRKSSFEEIKKYWGKEVKEHCLSEAILVIVGNKSHLYEREQVEEEEVRKYAESINAMFFLVSTTSVESVNDLFYQIGKRYLKIIDIDEKQNNLKKVNITDKKPNKKSRCVK